MRYREEELLQISLLNWFRTNYPQFKEDIHHFANERKCTAWEGIKLKHMGVTPGVYDLFIGVPNKGYAGLWLELKTNKGRLSEKQIAFGNQKNKRGYLALVVRGFDEPKKVISDYLEDYLPNESLFTLNIGLKINQFVGSIFNHIKQLNLINNLSKP